MKSEESGMYYKKLSAKEKGVKLCVPSSQIEYQATTQAEEANVSKYPSYPAAPPWGKNSW